MEHLQHSEKLAVREELKDPCNQTSARRALLDRYSLREKRNMLTDMYSTNYIWRNYNNSVFIVESSHLMRL